MAGLSTACWLSGESVGREVGMNARSGRIGCARKEVSQRRGKEQCGRGQAPEATPPSSSSFPLLRPPPPPSLPPRVVSGGADGVVKLWDLTAGKQMEDFTRHCGEITCLDFRPGRPAASEPHRGRRARAVQGGGQIRTTEAGGRRNSSV